MAPTNGGVRVHSCASRPSQVVVEAQAERQQGRAEGGARSACPEVGATPFCLGANRARARNERGAERPLLELRNKITDFPVCKAQRHRLQALRRYARGLSRSLHRKARSRNDDCRYEQETRRGTVTTTCPDSCQDTRKKRHDKSIRHGRINSTGAPSSLPDTGESDVPQEETSAYRRVRRGVRC